MPIEVVYQTDPALQATAAARGSGAAVAAEQDWRNRQMAEQQYQFDQEYNWRVQQAALQERMARYDSGNRTAIAGAQIQSNNYNNQLDYDLGRQTLAQRDEQLGVEAALQADQQQQLTNRTQMSQLGQIARQQQQQKFENAMADRKAAEDWLRTASPRQQQQFRARWEQKHGLGWTAPEEAMAQQDQQEKQARVDSVRRAFSNPFEPGKTLLPEGMEEWALQLTPNELFSQAMKAQGEERMRRALAQKPAEEEKKREEKKISSAQDVYKYGQQAMGDYKQAEADYAGKKSEYANEQAAHELAIAEWEAAKKEWAAQPAPADGKVKKPFSQKRPTFTKVMPVAPMPMQFAGSTGFPVARSVEEVQMKLASGEWTEGTPFLTPDGRVKFARIKEQQ